MVKSLWWIVLACVVGHARAEISAEAAEGLMRNSGLWQQLGNTAPQVRAGFFASLAQRQQTLSAAETERVGKVLDDAYSAERLRATSRAVIAKEFDEKQLPALDKWFAEPLGKKVAHLEAQAAKDGTSSSEQFARGSELLKAMPAARRSAIQDLVAASRAAEAMAEITIETMLAAADGAASVVPDAPRMPMADMRSALEAQRGPMTTTLTGLAAASFARMYASLSLEEIRAYTRFMRSDAGRHFNDVGLKAIGLAFREGATEMGRRLPPTKDSSRT